MTLVTPMTVPRVDTFWYVATPYSKYPEGIKIAFQVAARATAELVKARAQVFCPIVHSHPVAVLGGLDCKDTAFWLRTNRPFMVLAHGMLVVMMEGWKESEGIKEEIKYFLGQDKPVIYMKWPVETVIAE